MGVLSKRHPCEEVKEAGDEVHHDRERTMRVSPVSLVFYALIISGIIFFNILWKKQLIRPADSPLVEKEQKVTNVTWDDIEIVSFKRRGTISTGFKARIKGREGMYILKVTGDRRLHWSDTEIDLFEILNAPPTIPNVPKLELAIKSMPNPLRNRTYLTETLGMEEERAIYFLVECENISVMVMEYLSGNMLPSTTAELRRFLRSLLTTFSFAHSRNVMMLDLHGHNLYFDGTAVKLFDWNAGSVYKPNSVKIHYKQAPTQLFPPEAWDNESAVHATVSGFDIWTIGLMLKKLLKEIDDIDDATNALIMDFANATLTEDPYKRPDADKLLQHPFLKEAQKDTLDNMSRL